MTGPRFRAGDAMKAHECETMVTVGDPLDPSFVACGYPAHVQQNGAWICSHHLHEAKQGDALARLKPLPAHWTPKPEVLCDVNGSRVVSAQSVHGKSKWHADIPQPTTTPKLKVSRR